jgi:hypothetical protein
LIWLVILNSNSRQDIADADGRSRQQLGLEQYLGNGVALQSSL